MLETTTVGSLPKPEYLAETEKLWPAWRLSGEALEQAKKRILSGLLNANVKRVTLLPLMVVAGDHAANDMVGDEPDSWKNMFKNAGIEVIPVLRGLGELDGRANIYCSILRKPWRTTAFSLNTESRIGDSGSF